MIEQCAYALNTDALRSPLVSCLSPEDAYSFHSELPGYRPTPLLNLEGLAKHLGIGALLAKDEGMRPTGSFKYLGVTYALQEIDESTVCTATDGNHGRALARAAADAGKEAVVVVPRGTRRATIDAIAWEGANVIQSAEPYDGAVAQAAALARDRGYALVQDVAWQGYTEIPLRIMSGYLTMFMETPELTAPERSVDVVLLQAGVGSFAAAAAQYFAATYGPERPALISIEPTKAPCILHSVRERRLVTAGGDGSIMEGLNCGTPSSEAIGPLSSLLDACIAIPDRYTRKALRALAYPRGNDPAVSAGPSGAAGVAGLIALMQNPALKYVREHVRLGPTSRVLAILTEASESTRRSRPVL